MTKWLAVAALGAMMVAAGCKHHKEEPTTKASEPMKMSADASSCAASGECKAAK